MFVNAVYGILIVASGLGRLLGDALRCFLGLWNVWINHQGRLLTFG